MNEENGELPPPRCVRATSLRVLPPLTPARRAAGTLYVLPGTHAPAPGAAALPPPPAGALAAAADEPGAVAVTVAAGAAVVLHDAVLHCSGRNLSAAPRRAWMPQLSAAPLLRDDGRPVALAVPLARRAPPRAPPPRKRARRGSDAGRHAA